jgi:hypothetical protein
MDLPNEEVVNPFQSDEIFKDIFKNDKSNKIITNEGSKDTLKAIVSKALLEREIGQTPYYLKDEGLKAHTECDSAKSTIQGR